jgi:NADH-quinone oxidoreductase subunit E
MEIIESVTLDYRQYLSAEEIAAIEHEASILETREAAGIEALKVVQAHRGWVSDDSLFAIADLLNTSPEQLEGVATFYNLIYRQPVGRFVIHLCDSVACHLTGYNEVLQSIKNTLGIGYGQTTDDGCFTLLSNVCLGGCDKAPVMMIGERHFQNLNADNVIETLNQLRRDFEQENKNILIKAESHQIEKGDEGAKNV